MKKLILSLILLFLPMAALGANITYKTIGNTTTFYADGRIFGTYKIKNMSNGFVETETCYDGLCRYDVMTPMMAKNYVYTLSKEIKARYEYLIYAKKEEAYRQKQQKIKQANKSIIVKQVAVTAPNGEKISLQEDKNGDDYLVINGEKIKNIGRGIATYKDSVIYDPNPESSGLEQAVETAQREDMHAERKRTYEEIIYSSTDLCDLFKIVYKLRVDYGISYENAQKLMAFGIDNRHYKPSDLLLPSEKQAIKYQKNRESTSEKLKNITFPKI